MAALEAAYDWLIQNLPYLISSSPGLANKTGIRPLNPTTVKLFLNTLFINTDVETI